MVYFSGLVIVDTNLLGSQNTISSTCFLIQSAFNFDYYFWDSIK